jgi:two-component system, NarL family, sensor histidine kinase DegS
MSGAEQIEELNNAALALIVEGETQVSELERRLETLRTRLDTERRRVVAALEELSSRYLYAPGHPAGEARSDTGPLNLDRVRAAEQELSEQLLGCAALMSKLNGLTNLLAVSRGQFAPQGEAAADLDVWRLVERMAMIKAQELERSRLAREIHDGPAQVLANAILGLELCEQIARRSPEQLLDELARLKATMREGLVEVRRFQFDLRPSTLAERGLSATLQRYVAEYRAFFRLDVDLQVPATLPALSKDAELTVFRIVQESLQNIQKHARAALVIVRIDLGDETIVVTIHDDGRGFVPRQVEATTLSGAGLRGMSERAAAVGGDLQVESQPGAGTTVRLSVPRVAAAEEDTKL